MKKFSILLLLTFSLACTDYDKIPEDILPRERMETIVWQLMEADQYTNMLIIKDSTQKTNLQARLKLYQKIFDLNKITENDFKKSYMFYMGRPDLNKRLFDSITAKAGRQRGEAAKITTNAPGTLAPVPGVTVPGQVTPPKPAVK
jgi:hypothetical protein